MLHVLVTCCKLVVAFEFLTLQNDRMNIPELLLALIYKQWHKLTRTQAHTLTHRAISNQSLWLLCSSFNGGPDLRYAELFPPSPNFQATRGKRVWEKWREQQHGILLFTLQTFNSFHLASQFTGSRDHLLYNEKVGWRREWSLLREQPSALTRAFR